MFSTRFLRSAIGRKVIKYEKNITVNTIPFTPSPSFPDCLSQVIVNGPLGLSWPEPPVDAQKIYMNVGIEDRTNIHQRAMWGTTNSKLQNMIEGVTYGYAVPVKLVGVGYKATLEDDTILLKLGYANIIKLLIPKDVQVVIPNPQRILLRSIDLEKVTQFAASIRKHRKPEPYNQKGVFVSGETIRKKEGKKK